jgi:hypothetical protein
MARLLSSFFFTSLLFTTLGAAGCGVANLPPPPAPARIDPLPESLPAEPPADSRGRVALDVVDERAKVFEVTELTTKSLAAIDGHKSPYWTAPIVERTLRPLCITPCTVDLSVGWHSLVFESTTNEQRTSTADVTVSSKPTAVRHALGHEKPLSGSYLGGLAMLVPGVALTLMGAIALPVGALSDDSAYNAKTGAHENPRATFLTLGVVLLGVGAVLDVAGTLLMVNNRPERQPGSTTEWVLP